MPVPGDFDNFHVDFCMNVGRLGLQVRHAPFTIHEGGL